MRCVHSRLWGVLAVVWAFVLGACSAPSSSGGCKVNANCGAGYVCVEKSCKQLCTVQRDCPTGKLCVDSTCEQPTAGTLPSITTISGNDPSDATQILDGLLVDGTTLAAASFELQSSAGSIPLTVRSQSDTSAELVLPADIRSGDYVLVATNQAGSGQAPVQLTLPEIDGNLIIAKIKDPATTDTIPAARISSDIQRRITGTCTAGQAVMGVAADGSVTCQDVATAITPGQVPVGTGSGFVDSMIHSDTTTGAVGIGVTDPTGIFQVGSGYVYTWQENVGNDPATGQPPTPKCACDHDSTTYDCGSQGGGAGSTFTSSWWQGSDCYDTGTGGNDHYTSNSVAELTVTSGHVGVGGTFSAPQSVRTEVDYASAWNHTTTASSLQTVITKTLVLASPTYVTLIAQGHGETTNSADPLYVDIFVDGALLKPNGTDFGWGTAIIYNTNWVPVFAVASELMPAGSHTIEVKFDSHNLATVNFNAPMLVTMLQGGG